MAMEAAFCWFAAFLTKIIETRSAPAHSVLLVQRAPVLLWRNAGFALFSSILKPLLTEMKKKVCMLPYVL